MSEININKERLEIARDLSSKGFNSSISRVREIEEFNYATGKKNTITDIAKAYKGDEYKDQPEIREKLEQLGDSLRTEQQNKIRDLDHER